jgi:hypothetical protein
MAMINVQDMASLIALTEDINLIFLLKGQGIECYPHIACFQRAFGGFPSLLDLVDREEKNKI